MASPAGSPDPKQSPHSATPPPPPPPPPQQQPQMATVAVVSQAQDNIDPPMATPLALIPVVAQPTPLSSSSRRLPPPCWTPEETSALIDAYRDKWYSLRRGNLRAAHWDDVASAVHLLCPSASPAKTAVQCRHKMEKLRKRYRAELLRARSLPHHRFSSSWSYFPKMDSMEKGAGAGASPLSLSSSPSPALNPSPPIDDAVDADYHDHPDDDHDHDHDAPPDDQYSIRQYREFAPRNSNNSIPNHHNQGLKIKLSPGNSNSQFRSPNPNPNPNSPQFGYMPKPGKYSSVNSFDERLGGRGAKNGSHHNGSQEVYLKKRKRSEMGGGGQRGEQEEGGNGMMEMVEAIRTLGEGFVRMEKMKMEMTREAERMRMEMEMQRTKMILESQHRIVEAFAKAWGDDHVKLNKDASSC